ncbi:SCP-like protein [Cooperia oncophora]
MIQSSVKNPFNSFRVMRRRPWRVYGRHDSPQALQYHEGTRFTLALGESPNSEGYYHLPAKNLFKMRWNCTLEKEARQLDQRLVLTSYQACQKMEGIFSSTKQGKYNFLSDAVDFWLYESDRLPMGPNATFNDTRMYPFANMAYQMIYEVGCHYEQCGSTKASVLCIYNTRVPLNVQLYEIGSWNQTIAGCAWE